jgi:uncharacterized protein YuzE
MKIEYDKDADAYAYLADGKVKKTLRLASTFQHILV